MKISQNFVAFSEYMNFTFLLFFHLLGQKFVRHADGSRILREFQTPPIRNQKKQPALLTGISFPLLANNLGTNLMWQYESHFFNTSYPEFHTDRLFESIKQTMICGLPICFSISFINT